MSHSQVRIILERRREPDLERLAKLLVLVAQRRLAEQRHDAGKPAPSTEARR